MGRRPKLKLTLIEKKESGVCHYNHKIGDTFDFATERGAMCPMALYVAFPYIDILRYGGSIPGEEGDTGVFCCPDPKVINIFKIEKISD
jgi:uncharacterized repeat protein (TIGR04076 family)